MSGCAESPAAACFRPGTELPDPATSPAPDLATALASGRVDEARRLIEADPGAAKRGELLAHAVAGCRVEGVALMLDAGASPDGDGGGLPLTLALRAKDDAMARLLLKRGASPNPRGAPILPIRTVIGLNDLARAQMLIAAGLDLEALERTGRRALHIALDQERFRIAAALLDAGADPFAIDAGGANLGAAVVGPTTTDDPTELAAKQALAGRLRALGWPEPVPHDRQIARMAIEGAWPPAGARGARPVPLEVLALIRERTKPPR
ncbi:hypothetical protein [Sphingomonas sp. Y38-1Y]|uniref:ankyrin repeat domain-containing protein n=1 Tax=Sphingomonas sp. Y38-1Y TaxID=3078265 RepID=UPI0028E80278|nr:hypothetical protein [Sphingomonas sp. Y38-1Y]